jgi:hypothetical protein
VKRALGLLGLTLLAACASRPPCDEHAPTGTPEDPRLAVKVPAEPRAAKLVHLVTFEMGPIVESLTGYAVVSAPGAFRLYGMSETGQRAFEVAYVKSGAAPARVARIYRAPVLRDDRILDQIARASARIFLERPPMIPLERGDGIWTREHEGTTFAYAGPALDLWWMQGDKWSACFMDWTDQGGARVPERVIYRSDEGAYPYELRMKLTRAQVLTEPPAPQLFEPR